jgi:tetratricopeptide (TPR) repeat protein
MSVPSSTVAGRSVFEGCGFLLNAAGAQYVRPSAGRAVQPLFGRERRAIDAECSEIVWIVVRHLSRSGIEPVPALRQILAPCETGSNLQESDGVVMSANPRRAIMAGLFAFALLKGQQPAAPESADELFQSGASKLSEGKYKEAEEAYRKVYALEPGNPRGILGVAQVYVAQKKGDEAIQLLRAEAKKYPRNPDFQMAIGELAMKAAKYDLALEEFLSALNQVNRYSKPAGDLYFHIGEAYLSKGEADFAIIFLRQAKELLPKNSSILATLASALDHAGQNEAAVLEYRAALDIDPNNGAALNNLAFLLAENGGDLDSALGYSRLARQLLPNAPAIADTLAWVCVKKNMTDEAIGILRDLVQKDPAQPTYRYHLAAALEQKGDHSAAKEELTAALQNKPSKDEEQKIKELLQKIGK